jgi:hypothetical protein
LTRSIPDEVGYGPNNETDKRGGEFMCNIMMFLFHFSFF